MSKMKATILPLILATLFFAGCIESDQPLSAPQHSVLMPDLIGVWDTKPRDESSPWTISAAGVGFPDGLHRVTGAQGRKEDGNYFYITKLGKDHYANVVNFKDGPLPDTWDPSQITHFTIIGLDVHQDRVSLVEVDEKAVRAAAKQGDFLFRKVKEPGDVVLGRETERLASSTKKLREGFTTHRKQIRGKEFLELRKR